MSFPFVFLSIPLNQTTFTLGGTMSYRYSRLLLSTITLSLSITACATKEHRVLTGAAIGGVGGSFIANQQTRSKRATIVGAASGALLGGLVGYFMKPKPIVKKPTNIRKQVSKTPKLLSPALTRAKVSMYWEPDKIEDNKFIEKHRVWLLESGPQWTK